MQYHGIHSIFYSSFQRVHGMYVIEQNQTCILYNNYEIFIKRYKNIYIYIFKQVWKCEYYNWKVKYIVLNKFNEVVTEKKNYNDSNKNIYICTGLLCIIDCSFI